MERVEELEQEVVALRREVAELRRLVLAHITDKSRHVDPKRVAPSSDGVEYLHLAS